MNLRSTVLAAAALVALAQAAAGGEATHMERAIRREVIVAAPVAEAWRAWTTAEGAASFFAPEAKIELAVGGAYELYFVPSAPAGSRGSEGVKVLSYLPMRMLSFDWNAPPQFAEERKARTWVVVQFEPLGEDRTRVTLTHLGWRDGGRWPEVYAYFDRAWTTVMARLERRFAAGPIDWSRPYYPPQQSSTDSAPSSPTSKMWEGTCLC
jgi:uncharacterized protein YndB with AHSA1/START domain